MRPLSLGRNSSTSGTDSLPSLSWTREVDVLGWGGVVLLEKPLQGAEGLCLRGSGKGLSWHKHKLMF